MSCTTLIQQTASYLYNLIITEANDMQILLNKQGDLLLLHFAKIAINNYKPEIPLSSSEKQLIAIEIGRLFIIDIKSPRLNEYNLCASPLCYLILGCSNKPKLQCYYL